MIEWRHTRPYRAARVALSIARVFPRYARLVARQRRSESGGAKHAWPGFADSGDSAPAAPSAGSNHPADAADWERVHALAAEEIRQLALELGGALTKAAQILGARADVFPHALVERLGQFHDAVPPRPFETLRPIVVRDVGGPLERVFASVEPEALAAASLAQVHRATLTDGTPVVIKIQYPEIRRIIPLDLGMLRLVVRLVTLLQRRIDLRSLVGEVSRFIELELDFRREVDSTERLGRALEGLPDVRVPRVYRALCGDDVIVLEYLDGIPVTRTAALKAAGHSLPELARKIGHLYGAMIFEQGFFHGDPHPGNLLVLRDGRVGLLDFGLCKELPRGFAGRVARMMVASMVGHTEKALEAASELGFATDDLRADRLRSLMLMVIGDSDTDDGVLDLLSQDQMRQIPEDFALVARTLVLLNGLSHRLTPGRRLIQGALLEHLAAGARID